MHPEATDHAARKISPQLGRQLIASNPRWYHTMELLPGTVTPGWFDLRPILDRMPWPDVAGKRCLDVGPYDGFLSFELERRGAREVVAIDVPDFAGWDWPVRKRHSGPAVLRAQGVAATGAGFEIARRCLGSSVERRELSVYDLDPDTVGNFDVVTCGSLLLHLKDPVRALEAIRSVCGGVFLSAEQIDVGMSLRHRRRAAAALLAGERCQWWVPNLAAYRALVAAAGFEIEQASSPYAIPLGKGHPAASAPPWRGLRSRLGTRLLTRGTGVAHAALLAHPLPDEEVPSA
jgi:tRNA (mo5U34)-methyltransferase